jgi:hypothetical protein
MTTTSTTCALAAIRGIRTRALVVNPVVSAAVATEWYAPAMDISTGFGHKRPARRPPSPT